MGTMDVKRYTFHLLISVLVFSRISTENCNKLSACSCKTDSGHVIDLTSLGNTDGTPRFQDIPDTKGKTDLYSWNPCAKFTEGTCVDQAACKVTPSGMITQYQAIGTQDTATFLYDDQGRLILQYTADKAITAININCDNSEEGTVTAYGLDKEDGQKEYYFELNTMQACIGRKKAGLSIGTVICITLIVALPVYIVGGVLIQIFIRKESGRRVIPNYDFWISFPGLIRDGILFVFRRGKNVSYDKI